METPASTSLFKEARDVFLRTLRVQQLRNVLKACKLPNYGLKAQLLERIKTELNDNYTNRRVSAWISMSYHIIMESSGKQGADQRFQSAGIAIPTITPATSTLHSQHSTSAALTSNYSSSSSAPSSSSAQSSGLSNSNAAYRQMKLQQTQLYAQLMQQHYNDHNAPQSSSYQHHLSHFPAHAVSKTPSISFSLKPKFKPSPFYDLIKPISTPQVIPVWSQPPFTLNFQLLDDVIGQLNSTADMYKQLESVTSMNAVPDGFPSYGYSLYLMSCVYDSQLIASGQQIEVHFPHKPSVVCMGKKVQKFHFRGHDGPVYMPVDLTPYLFDTATNKITQKSGKVNVEFEIASKNFLVMVYLVRNYPVPTLVRLICNSASSSKTPVDVVKRAYFGEDNSDIVTSKIVLSLKCPLLYTNIQIPARGWKCNHLQCFDLFNFLLVQKQSSSWTCPICHKYDPVSSLGIGLQDAVRFNSEKNELEFIDSGRKGGIQICAYTKEIVDTMETKYNGNFDGHEVEIDEHGEWKIKAVSDSRLADGSDSDDCNDDLYSNNNINNNNNMKNKRKFEELTSETFVIDSSPPHAAAPAPIIIDLTLDE